MTCKEKQEKFLHELDPVYERLAAFARVLTKNSEDARDLISDTVLAAYEKFETLRLADDRSFKNFLFTVCLRVHKRKNWRRKIFSPFQDSSAEQLQDCPSDSKHDVEALHWALDQLPAEQKEALVLFDISGFSLNEICEIQNAGLSAVKSRISRARKKIAELLNAELSRENFSDEIPAPDSHEKIAENFFTIKVAGADNA